MLLLLAILLAFLAQNLLAPSALDFLGVICVVGGLAALLFMQRGARPVRAKRRSPLSLQGRGVGGEGGGLLVPAVIRARGFAPTDALAALLALIIAVWQLVPARLAAGIFIVIAAVLFVRQCRGLDAEPRRSEAQPLTRGARALLIGIILLSAFALTVYENEHIQPGIHGDEAESGIEARNLNAGRYSSLIGVGWYDQPLPSFLAQAWGMRVFGDTIGGLRTTSAVVGLLTLPLVYLLARRLFGLRVGLIALGLMAVSHWYNAYARLGINYNQTTLLEVAAVLAFWEGWQRRRAWWFVVSGLLTGAGLYLYFASRLTPVLLVAFAAYLWWWRRRARSQSEPVLSPRLTDMALWAATTVLVFLPMVPYFIAHSQELNSRADFVFLFNDSAKMNTFTGASEVLPALAVQVERYATLFNVGGDRSGQYGNTLPLIEYYTAAFFLLGLAYALYHARQPRYMLLLLWLSLTVFIGGVLTIESPFTPRIVGAMPVPFMLAAVALDRAWTRLGMHLTHPRREWAMRAVAVALAAAVITNNLWSYFGHYIHSIDGWAQREPATLVAQYAAQMTDDQKMYLLGAPELYIGHGTIRFLAPSLRGDDLLYPDAELPVRDPLARRAVFVVLPNYLEFVERLQALYPHGQIKEFRRPWGELQFVIYEAPAEDIERWGR